MTRRLITLGFDVVPRLAVIEEGGETGEVLNVQPIHIPAKDWARAPEIMDQALAHVRAQLEGSDAEQGGPSGL